MSFLKRYEHPFLACSVAVHVCIRRQISFVRLQFLGLAFILMILTQRGVCLQLAVQALHFLESMIPTDVLAELTVIAMAEAYSILRHTVGSAVCMSELTAEKSRFEKNVTSVIRPERSDGKAVVCAMDVGAFRKNSAIVVDAFEEFEVREREHIAVHKFVGVKSHPRSYLPCCCLIMEQVAVLRSIRLQSLFGSVSYQSIREDLAAHGFTTLSSSSLPDDKVQEFISKAFESCGCNPTKASPKKRIYRVYDSKQNCLDSITIADSGSSAKIACLVSS